MPKTGRFRQLSVGRTPRRRSTADAGTPRQLSRRSGRSPTGSAYLHHRRKARLLAIYSIGDLAKLSGIRAPTLRMWEQRYGVLEPKRTEANTRYYDDDDLRHLLSVVVLNRHGVRISQIAELDAQELSRRVNELTLDNNEADTVLDALTLSTLEMDEARFDRLFTLNVDQIGFEATMMTVVFPFLEKLGVLWLTGSVKPVQEAFTSGLIRRKLLVATDRLPFVEAADAPTLMLFLPKGETQEMSLLLLNYLARKRGYRTFYLGRDVEVADLEDAWPVLRPALLFTMVTETFAGGRLGEYVSRVRAACPGAHLLLSGYQAVAQQWRPDAFTQVVRSMHETVEAIDRWAARTAAAAAPSGESR